MRSPLAAWRSGVRWPLVLISAVVALVAVVLLCEAIGWPFLVGPVQHRLSKVLDRSVAFGDGPGRSSGVRIGLLGGIRVHADAIEIGPPSWSPTRHTMLARDAILKLGYLDLWRAYRGQTLHVRALEAGELDAILERLEDGRASWQFGKKGAGAAQHEASLPTFGRLVVGDGHVLYTDRVLPAGIDARFSLSDGAAPGRGDRGAASAVVGSTASDAASAASAPARALAASAASGIFIRAGGAAGGGPATAESVRLAPDERGLRLKATGQYRDLPVRIDLRTSGVLAFLGEGGETSQPLSLRAIVGRAEVAFDGTTRDPLHFTGLKGRFRLSGQSLANVGDALGITLPTTPPFTTHGTLVKDVDVWKAVFEAASIGSSRLNGAFTYDKRPKVPLLSGRLGGSRLVLADLGPAVGTPPPGSGAAKAAAAHDGRVIPDKRFDLPSLRAMNANVVVDIGTFDPGTDILEPLHPARAHLLLADGVLTIADFVGATAQGRLEGYVQLDGRTDKALWTADLRLLGVNLAQWLRLKRSGNAPPYLSGKLDALVKVKGTGRSTAEILGTLAGDLRMHMREAAVSHVAVEAGGIDVAQALGVLVKGDDALPILCNVADLDIAQGVATPKVFVVNTRDSTIWIDGTVSLRDETLDLRAVVSPKDFSPMSLRTPIHVKGTFAQPRVSLEIGKLAGKAGAAGLLALLNPLAALIPFIDPGAQAKAAENDAECANLVRSLGVIPKAVRTPKSARVPPAATSAASAAAQGASAARAPVKVAASAPRR